MAAESVKESPDVSQHEILVSSFLLKRNKSHKWQKRWVVLRRNQLAYYKDCKEYKALKVLNLHEVLSFNEIPDSHKFHFILVTTKKIFHLKATDEATYKKWMDALDLVINQRDETDEEDIIHDVKGKNAIDKKTTIKDDYSFKKPQLDSSQFLPNDFQSLQLSGTDDNFTSGDTENALSRNHSSSTINQITPTGIPVSIIEEEEDVRSDDYDAEGEEGDHDDDYEAQKQRDKSSLPTISYYNSLASSSPDHVIGKGNIYRLKKRYNQWKKYYMILTNHFLFFFKSIRDSEQNKIYKKIKVNDILDVVELDPLSRTKLHCMLIITPSKRIRFCAETEDDLTKWLALLKTLIKTRTLEKSDN